MDSKRTKHSCRFFNPFGRSISQRQTRCRISTDVHKGMKMEKIMIKDLGEASALVSLGRELVGIEESGTGFYWFVFEKDDIITELTKMYWTGSLQVSALSYSSNIRQLKNRLHAKMKR